MSLRQACIGSVIDQRTGRELVRQDAVIGFNGYVYDEYAKAGAFNHQSSKTVADDSMHLLASRRTAPPAALVGRTTETTGHTLVHECAPAGTRRLRVKVHLPRDAARVDVENRIDKTATLAKESAFFAFPFALDNPVVHTEATGGVLGTDRETVPGSATHMRAIRRWISLNDDTHHAALATADAPLVQLGGIMIPYAPYPQSLPQQESGTVFSWVHNNIGDTNFPAQQAFHHIPLQHRRYGGRRERRRARRSAGGAHRRRHQPSAGPSPRPRRNPGRTAGTDTVPDRGPPPGTACGPHHPERGTAHDPPAVPGARPGHLPRQHSARRRHSVPYQPPRSDAA
ncbi:hypothetical protein O3Q52_06710 [Streptomyces sp. ActVer]|uniref:hypothetical protein n=1 Tax=Streptomyces sp. ActVer TaxID=3014558 RepID=UPI0022B333D2|nr:hypothetical protein [Streptomyces sp. ActVer]MCZ4507894.1 hypothetical protein [Streptomyces sp. ActVer]